MDTDEDIELMLRVKVSELSAYETLYKKYQQPLANFFFRLGCQADYVEDCVQEVFLRLWRSRENYEPTAKLTTFLFQIAKNYWINESDKKKRHGYTQSIDTIPRNDQEKSPYEIATTKNIPADELQNKELQQTIQKAVLSLKEKHRIVFILSQLHGLKYKDIADILKIPIGTVKSRMAIAEQQLREKLQAYMPDFTIASPTTKEKNHEMP